MCVVMKRTFQFSMMEAQIRYEGDASDAIHSGLRTILLPTVLRA